MRCRPRAHWGGPASTDVHRPPAAPSHSWHELCSLCGMSARCNAGGTIAQCGALCHAGALPSATRPITSQGAPVPHWRPHHCLHHITSLCACRTTWTCCLRSARHHYALPACAAVAGACLLLPRGHGGQRQNPGRAGRARPAPHKPFLPAAPADSPAAAASGASSRVRPAGSRRGSSPAGTRRHRPRRRRRRRSASRSPARLKGACAPAPPAVTRLHDAPPPPRLGAARAGRARCHAGCRQRRAAHGAQPPAGAARLGRRAAGERRLAACELLHCGTGCAVRTARPLRSPPHSTGPCAPCCRCQVLHSEDGTAACGEPPASPYAQRYGGLFQHGEAASMVASDEHSSITNEVTRHCLLPPSCCDVQLLRLPPAALVATAHACREWHHGARPPTRPCSAAPAPLRPLRPSPSASAGEARAAGG